MPARIVRCAACSGMERRVQLSDVQRWQSRPRENREIDHLNSGRAMEA